MDGFYPMRVNGSLKIAPLALGVAETFLFPCACRAEIKIVRYNNTNTLSSSYLSISDATCDSSIEY